MNGNQRFLAQQILDQKKELDEYKENAMRLTQEIQEAKKTPKTSNTSQKNVKEMTEKEKMKYYFDMFSAQTPGRKPKEFFLIDRKGGERSVRRWPNSTIYCWNCGYDLKEDHHTKKEGGCRWKNMATRIKQPLKTAWVAAPVTAFITPTGQP